MVKKTNFADRSAETEKPVHQISEENAFQDRTAQLFVPHVEVSEISAARLSSKDDYAALLGTICGAVDDSQPVEQYDGRLGVAQSFVAAHQSPVCQIQWNDDLAAIYTNPGNVSDLRWGTGTMITNNLLLTCGHLFDQRGGIWERPRRNGTDDIITPPEIARHMHINFNYQIDSAGTLRPEQRFPILQLVEYRPGGLDMAICRIGGNPGATFGRASLSTTDADRWQIICIIGHPGGMPKRIEAGPVTDLIDNFIKYSDIDTLGGNSGSGILRETDGRLVGIHVLGGCTPSSPADGEGNMGLRITSLITVSPTLRAVLGQ